MLHIHNNYDSEYVFYKLVKINIVQSWSISRLAWVGKNYIWNWPRLGKNVEYRPGCTPLNSNVVPLTIPLSFASEAILSVPWLREIVCIFLSRILYKWLGGAWAQAHTVSYFRSLLYRICLFGARNFQDCLRGYPYTTWSAKGGGGHSQHT